MREKVVDLKIESLVDPVYDDMFFDHLDFTAHLQYDKYLQKSIIKAPDGRPIKAEYKYGGVLMAARYFTFTTDGDNLVTSRLEELVYIKKDDTETPRKVVKSKAYNPNDIQDGVLVMKERKQSREGILDEMKAFLGAYLQAALVQSLPYVILMTDPFWEQYSNKINTFVQSGSEGFKTCLENDDLSAYNEWINLPVQADPLITVKDYIINKLTY